MGKQECFICNKELRWRDLKVEIYQIQNAKKPVPDGMHREDRLCQDCFEGNKSSEEMKEK